MLGILWRSARQHFPTLTQHLAFTAEFWQRIAICESHSKLPFPISEEISQ
jgi:hypothetical protein